VSDPASAALESASSLAQYGPIGIVAFLSLVAFAVVCWVFYKMTLKQQVECREDRIKMAETLNIERSKHEATLAGYGMEMQKTAAQCSTALNASATATNRVMDYLERERDTPPPQRHRHRSGEHAA
jgi:F0F1-type ATP synthase membrane subunit b/b'